MSEIEFRTQYPTKYTTVRKEETEKFVSEYEVKRTNAVVSIETRPKRKRFKSRLVQK